MASRMANPISIIPTRMPEEICPFKWGIDMVSEYRRIFGEKKRGVWAKTLKDLGILYDSKHVHVCPKDSFQRMDPSSKNRMRRVFISVEKLLENKRDITLIYPEEPGETSNSTINGDKTQEEAPLIVTPMAMPEACGFRYGVQLTGDVYKALRGRTLDKSANTWREKLRLISIDIDFCWVCGNDFETPVPVSQTDPDRRVFVNAEILKNRFRDKVTVSRKRTSENSPTVEDLIDQDVSLQEEPENKPDLLIDKGTHTFVFDDQPYYIRCYGYQKRQEILFCFDDVISCLGFRPEDSLRRVETKTIAIEGVETKMMSTFWFQKLVWRSSTPRAIMLQEWLHSVFTEAEFGDGNVPSQAQHNVERFDLIPKVVPMAFRRRHQPMLYALRVGSFMDIKEGNIPKGSDPNKFGVYKIGMTAGDARSRFQKNCRVFAANFPKADVRVAAWIELPSNSDRETCERGEKEVFEKFKDRRFTSSKVFDGYTEMFVLEDDRLEEVMKAMEYARSVCIGFESKNSTKAKDLDHQIDLLKRDKQLLEEKLHSKDRDLIAKEREMEITIMLLSQHISKEKREELSQFISPLLKKEAL